MVYERPPGVSMVLLGGKRAGCLGSASSLVASAAETRAFTLWGRMEEGAWRGWVCIGGDEFGTEWRTPPNPCDARVRKYRRGGREPGVSTRLRGVGAGGGGVSVRIVLC